MSVRLAFSVAVEVDADILLVDEVLAVGDAAFQQKCFEQFEQLKRDGKTIVLVTHDMGAVERFCDRAMLIERGEVRRRSASRTRSRAPTTSSTSAGSSTSDAEGEPLRRPRRGRDHATRGSRTTAASGSPTLAQGEPLHARAWRSRFHAPIDDPIFAFHLRNEPRHTVFATSTDWRGEPSRAASRPARRRDVRVRFENWLAPSRYTLTPVGRARRRGRRRARPARGPRVGAWCTARATTGGIVDVPHAFAVERA